MFLKLYVIALILFLILDIVWIRFAARRLYSEYLGFLTKSHPNLLVGAMIYPLLAAGLVYFAIFPSYVSKEPFYGAIIAAFFGLVAYGSYDLTNYATVKNWPLAITIIDLVWGVTLCATVAAATYFISMRLGF